MDGVLTTNDDGDLDYGQYHEDRDFYTSGGEVWEDLILIVLSFTLRAVSVSYLKD